jgi:type I restriction enzyme S subunit
MENSTGNTMVTGNLAYKYYEDQEPEQDYTYLPDPLKYTSVSLQEVGENKFRLEASAFNIEAKVAKDKILTNKYGYVNLCSNNGLVKNVCVNSRFKRIYVEHKEIPFFQPSSITEVYPKPAKYISAKTDTDLNSLKVKKGMLLMTVSGTIGKVAIAGKKLDNQVFSHDLLRLIGKGQYDTGYIYAYFLTETGQNILQSNNYGAVIQHIEPEHFEKIMIPNAPELLKKEIHELVIASYDLRDQSNDLLDRAEQILYEELKLKPIEELKIEYFDNSVDVRNYTAKLNDLNLRLDCSYHLPIVKAISNAIKSTAKEVLCISNNRISANIILPGRFKRIYVGKGNGVPFFGGKQINELNPSNIKYLSLDQHSKRINNQLFLKENMIAVTCSGTIGKVNIIPKHWENWTLNQHVMRIVPANNEIAGYIYCWLNSDYGYYLITRHTYGSVVDEIDDRHLSQVEIPILKNQSKQQEINELVLQANELRYQAHLKEQEAIKKMEDIISETSRKI